MYPKTIKFMFAIVFQSTLSSGFTNIKHIN